MAGAEVGNITTLELIAAPAAAPTVQKASPVETTPAPALSEPVPAAVVEQNIPPPPATPEPGADPVSPPPPVAASEPPPTPTTTPVASNAGVVVRRQTATQVGDGSSALTGKDVTTATGTPTVKASPNYLKNQEPEYPLAARRRGQQGVVLLEVTVSPAGRATTVTVKASSGFELLDRAAVRAVAEYEFEPARLGSKAVESRIEVPIRFQLNR